MTAWTRRGGRSVRKICYPSGRAFPNYTIHSPPVWTETQYRYCYGTTSAGYVVFSCGGRLHRVPWDLVLYDAEAYTCSLTVIDYYVHSVHVVRRVISRAHTKTVAAPLTHNARRPHWRQQAVSKRGQRRWHAPLLALSLTVGLRVRRRHGVGICRCTYRDTESKDRLEECSNFQSKAWYIKTALWAVRKNLYWCSLVVKLWN